MQLFPLKKTLLYFILRLNENYNLKERFLNIQLIPDYDRKTQPAQIIRMWIPFQGDVDVDSPVLNMRVSFKWRHIINDTVIETIRDWAFSNKNERPHLVFLSKY